MSNRGTLGAELLQDLADKLAAQVALRAGMDEDAARQIAQDIAGDVARDWGGQSIYIPMDLGAQRAARNERIFKEFTGDNQSELAAKYGLSVPAVYRILKEEIERRRTPQGRLF